MNARFVNLVRSGALCWPILVVVALLWAQVVPCTCVYPDSHVYIELGRNLAAGRGYVYNDEPYFIYPPVFPAMLAAGIRLFGDSMVMMRAIMALAAMAFLAVSFVVIRKVAGWRWALFLVVLFGLSTQFVYRVAYVLSDLPGALMAVLALAALMGVERARNERAHNACGAVGAWTALAAVLTLLAVATRMANIGIVVGVVVQLLVLRHDRFSKATLRTALPLIALPLAGLALWYVARFTTGTAYARMPIVVLLRDYKDWDSGYLGPLGLAWRVVQNLGLWLSTLGSVVISMQPTVITTCLKWAATGLFLVGLCAKLVQRRGPIEAFTLGMLAVLFITPFTDQLISRYFLPLGPFLLMYVYEGVVWLVGLAQRLPSRPRAVLSYSLGVLLLVPVALELVGLRPLGGPQHPFGSPKILLFALAFAASMLVGLSPGLTARLRVLFLVACGALLLAFWAHTTTFASVIWVQEQRALAGDGDPLLIRDERVRQITDALKRVASPDEAVVSSRPALYRGLTGLRAYWFPLTRDQDQVLSAFGKARWIIVDLGRRDDRAFAQPVIETHPELFELADESDGLKLYRRTAHEETGE
ncbi:MAG: hypothetical protein JW889_10355 [Verrucomicrobia bacterium]|nr:hypothetical protein [Verrucomicrobiota bacterium]